MQLTGLGYQNYNQTFERNTFNSESSHDKSSKPISKDNHSQQNFAVGVGGLAVLSVFLHKATEFLSKRLSAGKEFTSEANVKNIADTMLRKNDLHHDVRVGYLNHQNKDVFTKYYGEQWAGHFDTVASGKNAFYADNIKLAVAPEAKPSLMLHELGHAVNSSKGPFMRFLQKSRSWAMAVPGVLAVLNGLSGQNNDGKKNFFERNAGLIGFGAFLPTIVEEGLASLRGIKAAKAANLGSAANINVLRKNYALAWGTYLLSGIGLGIAAKQALMEQKVERSS